MNKNHSGDIQKYPIVSDEQSMVLVLNFILIMTCYVDTTLQLVNRNFFMLQQYVWINKRL